MTLILSEAVPRPRANYPRSVEFEYSWTYCKAESFHSTAMPPRLNVVILIFNIVDHTNRVRGGLTGMNTHRPE